MSNSRSIFVDPNNEVAIKLQSFYDDNPYTGKYKGVTRVLSETKSEEDKKSLERWRERVGEEEANKILLESQTIGNSLDSMLEKYLSGKLGDIGNYKDEPGYQLFRQMKSHVDKITPIGMQIHLYDDIFKIQGYLDCIGYTKTKDGLALTMIDFKNSLKKKDLKYINDYMLQATIYCLLLFRMTGIIISDIKIMIAVRDGFTVQIFNGKLRDYIVEAKSRIEQFTKLQGQ